MLVCERMHTVMAHRSRLVSGRIQRVLREVAETLEALANKHARPHPQPVPVPVRPSNAGSKRFCHPHVNFRRGFGTFCGCGGGSSHFKPFTSNKSIPFGHKWLFKFYHKSHHGGSKILRSLNYGFNFNSNFLQMYQSPFRLKLYQQNLKLTYRSIIFNIMEKLDEYDRKKDEVCANLFKFNNKDVKLSQKLVPSIPTMGIRLNLSLTPKQHTITLALAKTESTATPDELALCDQVQTGCYIEFPVNFNLTIPTETILSEEILDEMIYNVQIFEKQLREFKQDLTNLFELGELPIKYIRGANVLRVYFPNCDVSKLESLCREKNVTGGIIFEDKGDISGLDMGMAGAAAVPVEHAPSEVSSYDVNHNDIISTYYGSNESVSSFDTDDVLTDSMVYPLSNNEIVRIDEFEPPAGPEPQVYDEYYWVSA